jgi:hypothetical protein
MFKTYRSLVALGLVLSIAGVAEAGPPLICHPFDAGAAQLLPWGQGQGWNTPDRSYDVRQLTADTLRRLSPDAPILARMENLRRATIYAGGDRQVAAELLSALVARAQSPEGSRDALAQFDAGYLVESYRQASHIYKWDMLTTGERAGYLLVTRAITLSGGNPEMEFAASLMKDGRAGAEHRRRAMAGAKAGSLLAKNLAH